MRIRAVVAAVLVLLSVGAACSSKKAAKTPKSTTTVTPMNPTTTLAPTTTVKGKSTPTTRPAKATTAEAAAKRLFDAWRAGDKATARQVATEAVVADLFSHPANGPAPTFQGCEPDGSTFVCSYTYEGGAMQFTVSGSAAAGFTVTKFGEIAD
jgi:hypothetical protein